MVTDLFARAPPLAPRAPLSHRTSLGWCLAISAFMHLALAWRMTFAPPGIATRGEAGDEGAGGATFEVSLRGPETETPVPLPPSEATPPSTGGAEPGARTARPTRRVLPASDDGTEASASTDDTEGASAVATIAITPGGHDDPITDSGRLRGRDDPRIRALLQGSVGGGIGGSALGNVALLDEASRCPDPVAGTWTAHRYSPEFRDWARFTLSITRVGDELTGLIRTRMWRGMPSDTRPPACTPDGWDYTVEMRSRGRVHGQSFDFGAEEHHIAHVECRSLAFGYNPDHFTGTFDAALDQLHTVNNDGGRDVNAAYSFRRSSCQPSP